MAQLVRKIKWGLLLAGDVSVLYIALWLTLFIRFGQQYAPAEWQKHFIPFSVLYIVWLALFYAFGLYDLRLAKNNEQFYASVFKALIICFIVGILFFYVFSGFGIAPKINLLLNIGIILFLFSLWRQLYNFFIKYPILHQEITIIGKHPHAVELQARINKNPQLGYKVSALIDPTSEPIPPNTQMILIAVQLQDHFEFTKHLFHNITRYTIGDFSTFYEASTGKIPLSQIDELWFLGNLKERDKEIYETSKRVTDIFLATMLLVVTVVLTPFVALAIKLDSKGSVIYSQTRVGKNGKNFRLLKFRSMAENSESNGAVWAQRYDPRVTRIGKILRATYLDELPQCVNVLKGDMSFVGPRPERPEFVDNLENEIPFYQVRHIIKPGITGWAQVNFPYADSKEKALEKLQYELFYVKNRSFLLDAKILLKTLNRLLKGTGN
jgi:exopolysaccharide biosynthesis polyprenyl glycosylphosphotransferase